LCQKRVTAGQLKSKSPGQTPYLVVVVVEVAGVEPASPELLVGLLRAQPLGDVTHRQVNGILSAGQPRFYVPIGPEALPIGEPSWMTPRADE
jgi:hypothetical protein